MARRLKQVLMPQLVVKKNGFTLIELVTVLVILGILAVTAIPNLTDKSSFEDYTVRDQLISRLRLVQLQGMNAEPFDSKAEIGAQCHWLVVKADCFYYEKTQATYGVCDLPNALNICESDSYNAFNKVSFTPNLLEAANYRFNVDGKLSHDSSSSPIKLNGDNSLNIKIESEGYIHEAVQ